MGEMTDKSAHLTDGVRSAARNKQKCVEFVDITQRMVILRSDLGLKVSHDGGSLRPLKSSCGLLATGGQELLNVLREELCLPWQITGDQLTG
jgi:hypothetical protein